MMCTVSKCLKLGCWSKVTQEIYIPKHPEYSPSLQATMVPYMATLALQVLKTRQHNHLVDLYAVESKKAPTFMERLGLVLPA